jgi:hypothetical protein
VRVSVSVSVPDSDTLTDTVGLKWTTGRAEMDNRARLSGQQGAFEWTTGRV